jgi:peptide/nickel transport system permease protein
MFAFIVRRIIATIPVMAVVALFVFSLLYIAPGDPAAVIAGDQATPADVEKIRQSLGLDRPFLVRFGEWVWQIAQGDLGTSIFTGLPVTQLIAQRIEPTLSLMVVTLILAVTIAVPMGVLAAWKAGTWIDRGHHGLRGLRLLRAGLRRRLHPRLCLRAAARLAARAGLHADRAGSGPGSEPDPAGDRARLVYVALIARITRATMLEVLQQDYIRTARPRASASAASCSCTR